VKLSFSPGKVKEEKGEGQDTVKIKGKRRELMIGKEQ